MVGRSQETQKKKKKKTPFLTHFFFSLGLKARHPVDTIVSQQAGRLEQQLGSHVIVTGYRYFGYFSTRFTKVATCKKKSLHKLFLSVYWQEYPDKGKGKGSL